MGVDVMQSIQLMESMGDPSLWLGYDALGQRSLDQKWLHLDLDLVMGLDVMQSIQLMESMEDPCLLGLEKQPSGKDACLIIHSLAFHAC